MTLVAGVGIGVSSVALAHAEVGVNIGIPGAAYAPEPVYAPPQYMSNRPLLLSLVRAGMAAGTTTVIAIGSAGNGESAITMNGSGMTQGSGMMPGTITTDIMATGGMTATVVAREATGTTTIETAMRGTTIDRNGAR